MKAIILNSGIGKRMRPFTNENPKCLAKLNGKTILEHELKNILHYNIRDIIITVGPFEEKIKHFIANKFHQINAAYVKNPDYNTTNYIYSLWLARHLIDDDVILLHGDMVFEKGLLGRLLDDKYHNCVLVNNKIKVPEKDFKGRIINGTIKEIGVNVFGKNAFFLAPIYKFSKEVFKLWMEEIKKFVERNELTAYAENAFNNISDKLKLYPVYYQDEFCMEVDDFNDLQIAKRFFRKNI